MPPVESVTLINVGPAPQALDGWRLQEPGVWRATRRTSWRGRAGTSAYTQSMDLGISVSGRGRLALTAGLLLAVAASLLTGCVMLEVARLNRIDLTELRVDGDLLYMAHEINSRTLDQFHRVMEASPEIETLVLTVVPGSVDDEINLQLGLEVHRRGLATHVPSGGLIASGGVDLFLAGVERTIEKGAFVGVHSWAAGGGRTGADLPRDHKSHRLYLDYYQAIDIPADFYWFTLESAPAGDMHWVSAEELERHGMITRPLVEGAAEPGGPFAREMLELRREVVDRRDDPPVPVR